MYLEGSLVMIICIKKAKIWLDSHYTIKQWLWFFILWFGGLFFALSLSYPLKLLMKNLS